MRKRLYIWLGVIALALVAGLVVFGPAERKDVPQSSPDVARNEPPAAAVSSQARQQQPAVTVPASSDDTDPAAEPQPMAQSNDKTFRVNASGRLVLDEQTRLNMEALFARSERDRLAEAKQQAIEPL